MFNIAMCGAFRCQKRFFTEELLQQHISTHKGFPCMRCCNVFDSELELKEHGMECKGFTAKMEFKKCESIAIATAQPLRKLQDRIKREQGHKKWASNGSAATAGRSEDDSLKERYYCADCDRYFKSGQSLGGHRARVHSVRRKRDAANGLVNKELAKWREGLQKKQKEERKELVFHLSLSLCMIH